MATVKCIKVNTSNLAPKRANKHILAYNGRKKLQVLRRVAS